MDFEEALQRFDNDRVFFDAMCSELMAAIPARISDLRTDLRAGNPTDLFRHAHNLKGLVANFSAHPIVSLALQLETLGKQGDLMNVGSLLDQLDVEFSRLRSYLISINIPLERPAS